jgi:hypothetical protein
MIFRGALFFSSLLMASPTLLGLEALPPKGAPPRSVDVFGRFERVLDPPPAFANIPELQIHDAYDADRDGVFAQATVTFRCDQQRKNFSVPGFAVRKTKTGPWQWNVRWSPLYAGAWTVTVLWQGRAAQNAPVIEFAEELPTIHVAEGAAAEGPLCAPDSDQRPYLRQRLGDGTSRALWLFGTCRAWVAGSPGKSGATWQENEWIDRQSELLDPMREHGINLLNQWMAPWEFQLVHHDCAEYWQEAGSWQRVERHNKDHWSPYRSFDQGRASAFDRLIEDCGEQRDESGRLKQPIYLLLSPMPHQCLQSRSHPWGSQESGWSPIDDAGKQGLERLNGFSAFTRDMSIWDFFCADPRQPLSDWRSQLFDHQANYFRYLIARWGYSRAVGSWVLIDELDAIGDTVGSRLKKTRWWAHPDCDRWLSDMVTLFHGRLRRSDGLAYAGDPFEHPVHAATTSYGDGLDPQGNIHWGGNANLAKPDILGFHWYPQPQAKTAAAIWSHTIEGVLSYSGACAVDRPRLISEFGAPERESPSADPNVLYPSLFHFAIWPALLSGHCGTPLDWNDGKEFGELRWRSRPGAFSRDRYPIDLIAQIHALRRFIGDRTPDQLHLCGTDGNHIRITGDRDTFITAMCASDSDLIGWSADFTGNAFLSIAGLETGNYQIQWYDPWSGDTFEKPGSLSVDGSPVRIDLQIKLDRLQARSGTFGRDCREYKGYDIAYTLKKVD